MTIGYKFGRSNRVVEPVVDLSKEIPYEELNGITVRIT